MTIPNTLAARSQILGRLRAVPTTALPTPSLDAYLHGPFGRGSVGARIDPATLVAPFEAAARGWRADVLHARPGDWPQAVRAALDARGVRRLVLGRAAAARPDLTAALQGLERTVFDQPIDTWKGELFDRIDAGFTFTEAGIADTGTLLLRPGADEPRTLSLVPPLHVALLRASTLYAGLPAALRTLAPEAAMPTNLLLVTGPSKTADIQQVLAFGAHGPKELVIVIVDDQAAPLTFAAAQGDAA